MRQIFKNSFYVGKLETVAIPRGSQKRKQSKTKLRQHSLIKQEDVEENNEFDEDTKTAVDYGEEVKQPVFIKEDWMEAGVGKQG